MTDGMDNEEDRLVAAEYALGLLSPGEARAFEDLMAVNAATRRDFAFWAERLSAMTNEIAAVNPPPQVRDRLNRIISAQVKKDAPPKPSLLQRLGILPALGGGLVAAALAIWVVSQTLIPGPAAPLAMARLVSPDNAVVVEVGYAADRTTLEIARSAGAPPDGQVFQLWLVRDDIPPISLGVLPDAEEGTLQLPPDVWPLLRGANCAISIEPPGGSPTGGPTGDIVALGPIVWDA